MYMNKRVLLISCLISCIAGIIWYAYMQEIIICTLANRTTQSALTSRTKKRSKLFFWQNNQWHEESQEILWHTQMDIAIQSLLSCWLTVIHEEQPHQKKMSISHVLLTASQT